MFSHSHLQDTKKKIKCLSYECEEQLSLKKTSVKEKQENKIGKHCSVPGRKNA